jgi:hypothetical protein
VSVTADIRFKHWVPHRAVACEGTNISEKHIAPISSIEPCIREGENPDHGQRDWPIRSRVLEKHKVPGRSRVMNIWLILSTFPSELKPYRQ